MKTLEDLKTQQQRKVRDPQLKAYEYEIDKIAKGDPVLTWFLWLVLIFDLISWPIREILKEVFK